MQKPTGRVRRLLEVVTRTLRTNHYAFLDVLSISLVIAVVEYTNRVYGYKIVTSKGGKRAGPNAGRAGLGPNFLEPG